MSAEADRIVRLLVNVDWLDTERFACWFCDEPVETLEPVVIGRHAVNCPHALAVAYVEANPE